MAVTMNLLYTSNKSVMQYSFSHFIFDTKANELSFAKKTIVLTKQHKDLLAYFLKNPNVVVSKEKLIDHVWNGRVVTSNTIDQSVSKLKKILSSLKEDKYFETIYGQGIKFCPRVTEHNVPKKNNLLLFVLIIATVVLLFSFYLKSQIIDKKIVKKPLVLMLSKSQNEKQWYNDSSRLLIEQLMSFSNSALLKKIENKPKNLDINQYIDLQRYISPQLNTVTVQVVEKDGYYTLTLTIVQGNKESISKSFKQNNIVKAVEQGSLWLQKELNYTDENNGIISSLLPDNPYIVESYLRGLSNLNNGNIDQASRYFELCIGENPDFYLALLALAKVKNKQGKLIESIELLDTLSLLDSNPMLDIAIATLRGEIFDTQGKPDQARDTYLQILDKYSEYKLSSLNDVRYNLSYSYTVLAEYQLALEQLDIISDNLSQEENLELLANVYQKKGSILLKLGQIDFAKQNANRALKIFTDGGELIGAAKVRSLLARIANHEADYLEAQVQLEHALSITRSLNYKLGTGATLNELIYLLMVQSQHTKAWELNKEMEQIALEIDYKAMLIASKQFAIDMAIKQKKWSVAEDYLLQHQQLAEETNNQSALIKNKLLTLDYLLDQDKMEDKNGHSVKSILDELQAHINQSQELRLQPRINQNLARWHLLNSQADKALTLLNTSRQLAENTKDNESIIDINNLLAKYYLDNQQVQKAMDILNESEQYNPTDYPYLLLKSKANEQLGNLNQALELAKSCKQQAIDLWTDDDEQFLKSLISKAYH